MDSRFVRSNGLLVLYITDFHLAILLILDFELIKGFSIRIVKIVSQITVSPCYESERKKQKLNDDNKKLRPGVARLHVDAERKLWKVTEVVHPSIQNFRN